MCPPAPPVRLVNLRPRQNRVKRLVSTQNFKNNAICHIGYLHLALGLGGECLIIGY